MDYSYRLYLSNSELEDDVEFSMFEDLEDLSLFPTENSFPDEYMSDDE